ncbi:MAG: polyhydroxyalkanoate depolymerase, partial [Variovorax paradoxus]
KDLIKGDDASAEAHRKFYDEYNAVLDMDADYYLETIKTVFQEFDLVNGTWDVKNPEGQVERVRPQDIRTTALLTVEGELDDISGSGQTQAAHDLCTHISGGEHYEVKGAGHYGIFSGRRWRDLVYPRVRAFIAAHDEPQVRTRRIATPPDLTSEDSIKAAPAARTPAAARKAAPAAAPVASATPARKAAGSRKLAPTASRKASATSRKPRA